MFYLLSDTRKWNLDMKIEGRPPAPRSFHSVTSVGNRVLVIGGRAEDNSHLSDVQVFDTGVLYLSSPV